MIKSTLVIEILALRKYKAFGYQEYVFNLLNYFHENRADLQYDRVIVVCDRSQTEYFKEYTSSFLIIDYDTPTLMKRFIVQIFLSRKLKLHKSDVILSTGNYTSPFKCCKSVLVIHDLLYLRRHYLPNFLMRLQRKIFVPRSVALADIVIAISDFTKYDIINNIHKVQEEKIIRIYNYFDFSKFERGANHSLKTINCHFFLCVSSSAIHKNLITVFKAFELFCKVDLETKLFVVGNLNSIEVLNFYNKLTPDVRRRIEVFKNISNTDLAELYKKADAYISATLFEGLGMPIVEAMYFGVPLILSDLEVIKEVTQNKATFFNPLSFEELSVSMLNYSKTTISKDLVLSIFSAENTSKRYIDLLNQFCN